MLWTKIKKLLLSRFHPELWRGAHSRDWVWSEDIEQATILSSLITIINLISIMVNMLIITTIICIKIIVNMLLLQEGEQWTSVQSQLSLSISGCQISHHCFRKSSPMSLFGCHFFLLFPIYFILRTMVIIIIVTFQPLIVCRYFIYGMQDSQNLERVVLAFDKFDIPYGRMDRWIWWQSSTMWELWWEL